MFQMCQKIKQRKQEQDLKFSFHQKCTLNSRDPTISHHRPLCPNFLSLLLVVILFNLNVLFALRLILLGINTVRL